MTQHRRHTIAGPYTDLHTTIAMEHAIRHLALQRFIPPSTIWDPEVQLQLLASLVAQAEHRMSDEVHKARDTGLSWATIGRLLGLPAAVARQRYSPTASHGNKSRPASVTTTNTGMMPLAVD